MPEFVASFALIPYGAVGSELDGRFNLKRPARELFARNLGWWLSVRELRASELATEVGVHRSLVTTWLSGTMPAPETLDKIANVLEIPVSLLILDPEGDRFEEMQLTQIAEGVTWRDRADKDKGLQIGTSSSVAEDFQRLSRERREMSRSIKSATREGLERIASVFGLKVVDDPAFADKPQWGDVINVHEARYTDDTPAKIEGATAVEAPSPRKKKKKSKK